MKWQRGHMNRAASGAPLRATVRVPANGRKCFYKPAVLRSAYSFFSVADGGSDCCVDWVCSGMTGSSTCEGYCALW